MCNLRLKAKTDVIRVEEGTWRMRKLKLLKELRYGQSEDGHLVISEYREIEQQ